MNKDDMAELFKMIFWVIAGYFMFQLYGINGILAEIAFLSFITMLHLQNKD